MGVKRNEVMNVSVFGDDVTNISVSGDRRDTAEIR